MKTILKLLSALALLILPVVSFLQLTGIGSAELTKSGLLVGTVLWFITAPFWMNKKTGNE
jgi:hypothetical protein